MANKKKLLLGAAILTGVISLILLAAGLFEPYTYTVTVSPSPEVKRNPFEAMERWFREEGWGYERLSARQLLRMKEREWAAEMTEGKGLVVLTAESWYNHPDFPRRELGWALEEGAHLILYNIEERPQEGLPSQELMAKLGREPWLDVHVPTWDSSEETVWQRGGRTEGTVTADIQNAFLVHHDAPPALMELTNRVNPPEESSSEEAPRGGSLVYLSTQPYAAGNITLCGHTPFMLNGELGRGDNAAFLYALIHLSGGPPRRILHFHSDTQRINPVPFWKTRPFLLMVLLPAGVLIILLIMRLHVVFAPPLEPRPLRGDSLERRFLAEGRFHWKNRNPRPRRRRFIKETQQIMDKEKPKHGKE